MATKTKQTTPLCGGEIVLDRPGWFCKCGRFHFDPVPDCGHCGGRKKDKESMAKEGAHGR